MYFLMRKDFENRYSLMECSSSREKLIRFLQYWLKINGRENIKPVKILENGVYHFAIKTDKEKLFIMVENSIDFSDFM